ncbi:MAG TPA: hypothetical protein VGE04_02360 [Chloroflexia bacterium]
MSGARPDLQGGKRSQVAVLVAFFGFCSLSGFVWGLFVRTPLPPDPTIESVSVFPAAFDVATPTVKPPGLAGPTATPVINSTLEGLLNYDFRATGAPDEVLAFYKDLMQSRYGFKVWWLEDYGNGVQVLTFLREVRGWDKEYVTVTIIQQGAGQLYVEVRYKVQKYRP